MRLSTPMAYRRSTSVSDMTEAAYQQLRLTYSLGFMVSRERKAAGPNLRVAWSPSHLLSIRAMTSGAHHAPFSASTYFRPGCRSKTPPRTSAHSGLAAHQYA